MKKLLLLVAVVFSIGNAYSQLYRIQGFSGSYYWDVLADDNGINPVNGGVDFYGILQPGEPEDGTLSLYPYGGWGFLTSDSAYLVITGTEFGYSTPQFMPYVYEMQVTMGSSVSTFDQYSSARCGITMYEDNTDDWECLYSIQYQINYDPSFSGRVEVSETIHHPISGDASIDWWMQF